MGQGGGQTREHCLGLTCYQIGSGWGNSAVRDVHHKSTGLEFKKFSGEVGERTSTRRAIRHLARIFPHEIEKAFDILNRHGRIDTQHIRSAANHADRGEIFDRVVRQFTRGRGRAVGGDVALHQGVTVCRGTGGGL